MPERRRGGVIDIDPEIHRVLSNELQDGYLRECEAKYTAREIDDYALFPGWRMLDGRVPVRANGKYRDPIWDSGLRKQFRQLERIAGVPQTEGRGWYGLRRLNADLAADLTKDSRVLNAIGAWAPGSTTRERIYQDREREAVIQEAARIRAEMRQLLLSGKGEEIWSLRARVLQLISECNDPERLQAIVRILEDAPRDDGTTADTVPNEC